jgi:spermidine synthase
MSTALTLAGWLLWTALGSAVAARLTAGRPPSDSILAVLLALMAVTLPGLLLLVRGARWLFGIPAGELATIGKMVLVCLAVPALFCPLAGALFGLCWAHRQLGDTGIAGTRALTVYLGEALGAALGGVAFFFVILRSTPVFSSATVVALLLLCLSGWVLWREKGTPKAPTRLLWWLCAAMILALSIWSSRIDALSRWWQWGDHLLAARDTPFHNLAFVGQGDQITVFANGLWLFTEPDPVTTELAVHVALLQHPEPRRLLFLGGGLAGQLQEALKHPSVETIDYVEQDPQLISFATDFSSQTVRASLEDPRVDVHPRDAGTFLRGQAAQWDVILMSVGDPINAQMNRFYTVELFRRIAARLRPGGIFSFSVPGGGDTVGPAHARLLSSIDRTLAEVFPRVVVLPGERARFLAAADPESLTTDPMVPTSRIHKRSLDLVYLREDTLFDHMNPMRIEYLQSILAQSQDSPVNRQFAPVCYFHGMMLWAAQWHPELEQALSAAAHVKPAYLLAALIVLGLIVPLVFWTGRSKYRLAVGAAVFVQGGVGMVLQLLLILSFQILQGFAYLQLALIIAFFMAGLAVGALLVSRAGDWWQDTGRANRWFLLLQIGVAVYPLLLLAFFSPLGEGLREGLSAVASSWVFSAASLAAGALGGAHFALAALVSAAAGARPERAGGYLYAVDLAGAAGGALVAGLLVLPLYGVTRTLVLLSLLSFFCLLAILRRPALLT